MIQKSQISVSLSVQLSLFKKNEFITDILKEENIQASTTNVCCEISVLFTIVSFINIG